MQVDSSSTVACEALCLDEPLLAVLLGALPAAVIGPGVPATDPVAEASNALVPADSVETATRLPFCMLNVACPMTTAEPSAMVSLPTTISDDP
jgi:hypothetical protein